ncbi:RNA-directed DNA polymerase [Bordetella bronchiseptica B18-5 (C3)]|nr:RNA-directed DNA polymerase [Bordetella bronchiseptica B18-5 (C3)]KDD88568.1 RNA-directed DNA polymerase [Bordetella bronchiseptica MBORD762]
MTSPIKRHMIDTKNLAKGLKQNDIYQWLLISGYYAESYVLPPCFYVAKIPSKATKFFSVKRGSFKPDRTETIEFHFPKSELSDRDFGIIDPYIHNDIAYHISRNWKKFVDKLLPSDSCVTSYSFPLPISKRTPHRLGSLRSGRLIYEFIDMTDDDLASVAYKYTHIVTADIKRFYPSIYTHSIAWAIHGKSFIRRPKNLHNFDHVGNRLDKLFQNANDGCTNGIPIGPVVSDLIGELIAAAVDRIFTKAIRLKGIDCEAVRFKDDYRILVKSESDGKTAIKLLQASLKEYGLELSDEKTRIYSLPNGLFRDWISRYHLVHPRKKKHFTWKQFRELYLAVIDIDRSHPGTGVIDRFLADITKKDGALKFNFFSRDLEKVISMLLMLGNLRIKSFPKIIAILETLLRSPFGVRHERKIIEHLDTYLQKLSEEEERNKYLITWIGYFLSSNGLIPQLSKTYKFKDPIPRSVFSNQGLIYKSRKEFKIFVGCKSSAKRTTLVKHLAVFNPVN